MRFLRSKTGTVHVIHHELDMSSCPVVTRAKKAGTWKGHRSLTPEQVLESGDCHNCESHKHARSEIRKNKAAAKTANAGVVVSPPRRTRRRESPVSKIRKADRTAREVQADERTTAKVKEHAALAEQHGWTVSIAANERGGLTVVATREEETCVLAYRPNGILWNDEIVFKVPGRSVPMHNSGTWRRQISLPEGKRPIPARPKRFGRRKSSVVANGPEVAEEGAEESAEIDGEVIPLNKSSLPFPHDADDIIIVDAIRGRTLYWRNNMLAKVVSAQVPSKPRMIRFGNTGRAQRRYVSFPESAMTSDGEMYGPERCVAIEDMLRVR